MVLVFFILLSIIIISLFSVLLILSTLKIEVNNLKITNKRNNNKSQIKDKYQIKISIRFLEKIPIIWINLNNKKIKKINTKIKSKNINFSKMNVEKLSIKEIIEIIKNIKIRISELNLKINIGTVDAVFTSYIVAIISILLGIVVPHLSKEHIKECRYVINPKYENKNEYEIFLDGIIHIKIVHIIYTMFKIIKKGRDKNERTSNRRSYAYRYE